MKYKQEEVDVFVNELMEQNNITQFDLTLATYMAKFCLENQDNKISEQKMANFLVERQISATKICKSLFDQLLQQHKEEKNA